MEGLLQRGWEGSGEMAQHRKTPVIKRGDLGSIPGTNMVEGENQLLRVVL